MNDALDTARRHLTHVPKMIPVYEHRNLPAGCCARPSHWAAQLGSCFAPYRSP
jgi:hypothetical protein